jgi:hypothetical protein
LQLDAVLGHGVERGSLAILGRAVDHARIHAGLHRFQNVPPGQVDRGGPLEAQVDDLRLAGYDHRADHQRHVASCQIMRFERLGRDAFVLVEARLHGHDLAPRDHGRIHLPQRHPHQVDDADPRTRGQRLNPKPKIPGDNREDRQPHNQQKRQPNQHQRVAIERTLGEQRKHEHRLHGIPLEK